MSSSLRSMRVRVLARNCGLSVAEVEFRMAILEGSGVSFDETYEHLMGKPSTGESPLAEWIS